MIMQNPTATTYTSLTTAYDWFNRELFDGTLPPCLITMQRHKGSYGYFSGERFQNTINRKEITDEIALNPTHFASRTPEQVLSTLVHEMVHLWQHHFGKPPRNSYHDREWARKMRQIGLIPTATGEEGGKETGQKIHHLIEEGGNFQRVCASFLASHPAILYSDRALDENDTRKKKLASKR
jgi:SprT-like family